MSRIIVLSILGWVFFCQSAWSQLSIDRCKEMAKANYPIVKQYDLLSLSEHYDLENAAKGNLPQVSISGKASYQSDVTSIPVSLPGISINGLPKDQYQVVAEVSQNLWDGGKIGSQRNQTKAQAEVSRQQVDVNMYQLDDRVNRLFFGILLQDEQLRQNALLQEDLERNRKQITSYMKNGIANEADLDAVNVQLLTTRQQRTKIEANRKAYLSMLSLLTGEKIPENVRLVKPGMPLVEEDITRPELNWYDARIKQIDTNERALKTAYMPRLSIFAQGGIGRPGLNILDDGFKPFYIVGARLTWNMGSLYTLGNDRKKMEAGRQSIVSERDAFLLNTRIQVAEQDEAVKALRRQMEDDDEIISLRTSVRKSAEAKVAGGTLSVMEMLRELTNENRARQTKAEHELQLLMCVYQKQYLTNSKMK